MSGTGVGGAAVGGAGMSGTRRRARAVGSAPQGVAGGSARWPARVPRRAQAACHRDRGRPPGGLAG